MTILIQAAFMLIGIALFVLGLILKLFIKNIIVFESILLGIAAAIVSAKMLSIHPAFALLIGIGVFILFTALQNVSKIGFVLATIAMSAFWGAVNMCIGMIFYGDDRIWRGVVFGMGACLSILLHISARGARRTA
jgi:hypothetical protein